MKVLQLSTLDNKGGAAMVAWELMKGLKEKNVDCKMIVRHKMSDSKNVAGMKFSPLQQRAGEILADDVDFGVSSRILKNKFYLESDIVHAHNLHGPFVNLSLLSKISKIKPLIWTLHDMWAITGHCSHSFSCNKYREGGCSHCPDLEIPPRLDWDNTRYLWLRKKSIYQKSKLNIVVPSKWLLGKMKGSILEGQPVEIIHNGIDTKIFKLKDRNGLREKLGLPRNKKIICCSANGGKSNYWKGENLIDKVIDTDNGQEVMLLNIGGDKQDSTAKVINTGYIDDKNILADYYNASDLFLFTSKAENFPLVILEAMACGLPVVSNDVGGVKEVLVSGENGYLAKYNDVSDLANGVRKIFSLDDRKKVQMQKINSVKIDQGFSLEVMTDKYIKLYERLV